MSSAFIPTANTSTDGHQSQVPSNGLGYSQIPYFAPVIGQYFSSGAYQFNPAMSNPFPTTQHVPTPMQGMPNIHPSHSQVAQLAPSDPSNPLRLLSSNQFAFYNQNNAKNEFLESSVLRAGSNNPSVSDSKSSSAAESLGSGESSPGNENRTPARTAKTATKTSKGFKSPEEEVAYRIRRQKNNEAARQSRVRRHQRERDLQTENEKLKREVEEWKSRYNALLATYHKQPNHVLNEIQNQKI